MFSQLLAVGVKCSWNRGAPGEPGFHLGVERSVTGLLGER